MEEASKTKFCKHCGAVIASDAVMCVNCGRQVEELKGAEIPAAPQIVVNNTNTNANVNTNTNVNNNSNTGGKKQCNKWVSFCLCVILGYFGAHKFYEGKPGKGVLYLCTFGLCGIGVIIDAIAILAKPNPYYV